MLNKAETLKSYKLLSLDGEMGTVKDIYFDDHHWTIRYLVVDTGSWLPGRQVLISPHAVKKINKEEKTVSVNLNQKQIAESPSLDTDKPVSRQFEEAYYNYYQWPMYWGGARAWGPYNYITHDRENWVQPDPSEKESDPHLRSIRAVKGNHLETKDGEMGHVEDFIFDDETWAIYYLVINTRNWWDGKEVLISPKWIESVSWSDLKVFVNLSRQILKQSPEYISGTLPTREYEIALHQYYNRQGYWADEPEVETRSLETGRVPQSSNRELF